MNPQEPQFLQVGQGPKRRRLAYAWADSGGQGSDLAILWLSGFLSDMTGTKAVAVSDWAAAQGHAALRFDYSGHGQSEGSLLAASIGDWLEEATAMFDVIGDKRVVVVGSSLGGWIALLLARALAKAGDKRLSGLVLIAPAWDMTEKLMWEKMSERTRATVETEGVFYAPSDYDDPYPITKILIEEGRSHLIAGGIDVRAAVRILQGMCDTDVPWRHALALVDLLSCDDVELILVKDGDHRLSRPEDIRRLEQTIAALVNSAVSAE